MCKCESVGCPHVAVVELDCRQLCELCGLMAVGLDTEFHDEDANPFSEDDSSFEGDMEYEYWYDDDSQP